MEQTQNFTMGATITTNPKQHNRRQPKSLVDLNLNVGHEIRGIKDKK